MHFVQWHETPNYWIKSGINDPCKIDVFLCKILWFYNFLLKVDIPFQMNEKPLLNIKIIVLFLNFTLAAESSIWLFKFPQKTIDFPLIEFKLLLIILLRAMRGLKKNKIQFSDSLSRLLRVFAPHFLGQSYVRRSEITFCTNAYRHSYSDMILVAKFNF